MCSLLEVDDHVEVNGEVFPKPFVEKPVCAEDHNVYIYYPTSAGGGSQRLFRKVAVYQAMQEAKILSLADARDTYRELLNVTMLVNFTIHG